MRGDPSDPMNQPLQTQPRPLGLTPGELVRVRSVLEIGPTLDAQGALDGVPFMPEMLQYCGRTFRVSRRADKTCAGDGAVRRMQDTVHLADLRCDGASHGGCQAACLLFWKEAWLERVPTETTSVPSPVPNGDASKLTETLVEATRVPVGATDFRYRCQATEIPNASRLLRRRELDQYVRDVRNWGFPKVLRGLFFDIFNLWQSFSSRRLPRVLRFRDGQPYPFIHGPLPVKKGATPSATLDLRPGDLVRIKSKDEIEATLDEANHNRGLLFDGEMARYCGRTARVRARVERLVDEHTGEMIEIKSDCIMLEGVVCSADYHRCCSRGIYSYWREIWLERVDDATGNGTGPHRESALGQGKRSVPPCMRAGSRSN
jgi:hypothetical protein